MGLVQEYDNEDSFCGNNSIIKLATYVMNIAYIIRWQKEVNCERLAKPYRYSIPSKRKNCYCSLNFWLVDEGQ